MAVIGQTGKLSSCRQKAVCAARRHRDCGLTSAYRIEHNVKRASAAGAENIVLDVKYGSGAASTKTPDDAKALASEMVKVGASFGRKVSALITDMDKPLGNCVGNSLEVIEAGKSPAR